MAEGCPRLAVAAGSAINTRRSTSHITTLIHQCAYIKYVNQGSSKYTLTKYAMHLNTDINTRRSTSHITAPLQSPKYSKTYKGRHKRVAGVCFFIHMDS